MLLENLKEEIVREVALWAESQGLPPPEGPAFAQAPPHVQAELSLPWPLQAAKAAKKSPLQIAEALAESLASKIRWVDLPRPCAPGFVNFRLKAEFLCENLRHLLSHPEEYGRNPNSARRSILIEFVSANPTGPLHLASGRAAALGDSLARILRRVGHAVGTEYYVNDAGRQVELLGESVEARWLELHGRPCEFPEEGYRGSYVKDVAAASPPEAARWKAPDFGRFAIERMLALHRRDMEDFGVRFDRWFLESELHKNNAVESALAYLRDRKMAYDKDKAVWLGTSAAGAKDDKDRVLVRSDGRPTYFLADIAYHKDKFDRGWEELIDIWGADHHGYVPRMEAAVAALGRGPGSFHAVIHQLVHLYRGKELVKMSKRAGEFVTLRELMEEAGRDACRFFFAMRGPNVHMNFDLELAKKQSQENPVYYAQYVHARICSIFREAAKAGLPAACAEAPAGSPPLLKEAGERALLVKLAWFPDALAACEAALSPHPLTTFIMELAGLFHPFYERCRVVDPADKPLSRARLGLCAGVRSVIKEGLGLLGVSSPETM